MGTNIMLVPLLHPLFLATPLLPQLFPTLLSPAFLNGKFLKGFLAGVSNWLCSNLTEDAQEEILGDEQAGGQPVWWT